MGLSPTSRKTMQEKRVASGDHVIVESKFDPESVSAYYYSYSDEETLMENAKKHLAAVGWTFFYESNAASSNIKELRYRSPSGTLYSSLKTACKECLDEMNPEVFVPKNSTESTDNISTDGKETDQVISVNFLTTTTIDIDGDYPPPGLPSLEGLEIPSNIDDLLDDDTNWDLEELVNDLDNERRTNCKADSAGSLVQRSVDQLPMNIIHEDQHSSTDHGIVQEINPSAAPEEAEVESSWKIAD